MGAQNVRRHGPGVLGRLRVAVPDQRVGPVNANVRTVHQCLKVPVLSFQVLRPGRPQRRRRPLGDVVQELRNQAGRPH